MICTQFITNSDDNFSNEPTLAPFDDVYPPQEPDTTRHLVNDTEDSLSFEVGPNTLDICRLHTEADTLLISLSDDAGNFISNVKIPLALVQQYISKFPQSAA
jgi:hypothetical protein